MSYRDLPPIGDLPFAFGLLKDPKPDDGERDEMRRLVWLYSNARAELGTTEAELAHLRAYAVQLTKLLRAAREHVSDAYYDASDGEDRGIIITLLRDIADALSKNPARSDHHEDQASRKDVEPGMGVAVRPTSADCSSRPDHGIGEQTGTNRETTAEVGGSAGCVHETGRKFTITATVTEKERDPLYLGDDLDELAQGACEHGVPSDMECGICDVEPTPTPMMQEAAKLHDKLRHQSCTQENVAENAYHDATDLIEEAIKAGADLPRSLLESLDILLRHYALRHQVNREPALKLWGWWDEFNDCPHRTLESALAAQSGGNTLRALYTKAEDSQFVAGKKS